MFGNETLINLFNFIKFGKIKYEVSLLVMMTNLPCLNILR